MIIGVVTVIFASWILLAFVVTSPASLVSKLIGAGGSFLGTLIGIKTVLDIIKLSEENEKLRKERELGTSRMHIPSDREVSRFGGSKIAILSTLVCLVATGWAAVTASRSQDLQVRSAERQAQQAKDAAATTQNEYLKERNEAQSQIERLKAANSALVDQLQEHLVPPNGPERGTKRARQSPAVKSSSQKEQPSRRNAGVSASGTTAGSPELTIKNGFSDITLNVAITGPSRRILLIRPNTESGSLTLSPGTYTLRVTGKGLADDTFPLQAKQHVKYSLELSPAPH
jgi:hypothetical protein